DWYGVGVLLYEALTGRLPFDGPGLDVVLQKRARDPLPPNAVARGVPGDLNELCVALLQREPRARPDGAGVLAMLRAAVATQAAGAEAALGAPFVGRDAELARLDAAAAAPGLTALAIEGAAGVGASALADRFARRRAAAKPAPLVLRGRCFE